MISPSLPLSTQTACKVKPAAFMHRFVAVSEKAHRLPFCAFLFLWTLEKHVTMHLWCTLVILGNSFDQLAVIVWKLWNAVKRLQQRFQFVAQRPRSAGLLLSRATLPVIFHQIREVVAWCCKIWYNRSLKQLTVESLAVSIQRTYKSTLY